MTNKKVDSASNKKRFQLNFELIPPNSQARGDAQRCYAFKRNQLMEAVMRALILNRK